jgi:hypothetical protein
LIPARQRASLFFCDFLIPPHKKPFFFFEAPSTNFKKNLLSSLIINY